MDITNYVSSMITLTVNFTSAQLDGKLSALYLAISCVKDESGTKTKYQFYMKSMDNPVSISARSALSKSVKFVSCTKETYRVLRSTSVDIALESKA